MANNPLGMQKVRQILLLLQRKASQRSIVEHTGVSRPTIRSYLDIFNTSGLSFDELLKLEDQQLQVLVKGEKKGHDPAPNARTLHFLEHFDYFISGMHPGKRVFYDLRD